MHLILYNIQCILSQNLLGQKVGSKVGTLYKREIANLQIILPWICLSGSGGMAM